MPVFRLTMLSACDGDCLLLSWGEEGSLDHILVDGGRAKTYPALFEQLQAIKTKGERLRLLVLTHIDGDHISGALTYLKDWRRPIEPENVWFNGYRQIKAPGSRSMRQGDEFSKLLDQLKWPLNAQFEEGVVSIESASDEIDIAGLKIRIVSPRKDALRALGNNWEKWRVEEEESGRKAGVRGRAKDKPPVPDPLVIEDLIGGAATDTELPNGASIAFIAEWQAVRVLLAGDAHPNTLVDALTPLAARDGGRTRIDLLKASHHGSKKNTSFELIELLDCRRLAISTNGAIHNHPDPESIARFIHYGVPGKKILYFNYRSSQTLPWLSKSVQEHYGYTVRYPVEGEEGILEIDLLESADGPKIAEIIKPVATTSTYGQEDAAGSVWSTNELSLEEHRSASVETDHDAGKVLRRLSN